MILPTPSLAFLTSLARSVLAAIACGTLALALVAMLRRWHHDRFDLRVKNLCIYYGLTPAALLRGKCSPYCLAKLRALPSFTLEFLLEPLLLKCASAPPLAGVVQELCLELGLIDTWQRRLLGQFPPISLRQALTVPDGPLHFIPRLHFLLRARSARNLGLLRHQASWPILVRALDDPHPDVQQVALRSLGAFRESQSLPALLAQMDKAVTENHSGLSLHSLKAALAKFPLAHALRLLPAMRHPHPRVRQATAEILLEMAKREPAGPPAAFSFKGVFDSELARLVSDADPGVRALASKVSAHFNAAVSRSEIPEGLTRSKPSAQEDASHLLKERPKLLSLVEIERFLTDPRRPVRQAALRALVAHGAQGVARLYERFLTTEDKSLQELIVDVLLSSGLLLDLLHNLGNSAGNLETRVVERLLSMDAARYLHAALTNTSGRGIVEGLLEKLEDHSPPKIDAWLKLWAALRPPQKLEPDGNGPSTLPA